MNYVPLHTHSVFSFHAGVCTISELVARAITLGLKSLALTDIDRMSGLILFYLECRKSGIKPILGVELTDPSDKAIGRLVLLAKNADGYADLCELITQRQIDDTFCFEKTFAKKWNNLIFITHSPHLLELFAATPNRTDLYGELINNSSESRTKSLRIEEKAVELNIRCIVSDNSFFLHENDWETHKILTAIGLTSTLSRLKPDEYSPRCAFLHSCREMERLFPRHGNAIAETGRIAERCTVELDLGKLIMPRIEVPLGFTPDSYLRMLAMNGLEANYAAKNEYHKARELQEMELSVIEKLGYPSYFLIVKDVHDWSAATLSSGYRRPVDTTILRGSAANSITFYNLGVSTLDPIKHDLYFQRFLNEDRASPPDADLDFGWDERERALDYMVEHWGREHVAITSTTNHFRGRAAFRETAKVFGYSEEQVTTLLSYQRSKTKKIDAEEIRFITEQARAIKGKPRFLGQHPGGVLLTNDPIQRHCACEYTTGPKRRLVTQIDMHNGIDELGLIKFDLLGNGSLSVLRDTLRQLADQGFTDPQVSDVDKCCNDSLVQEMVSTGRTRGIFYIESPAQTRLNTKAQARTFEEITITSSLVRPAGARYTKLFVERHRKAKQGIVDWSYLHPSLEPILHDTHDVCAFQEDITKICHLVAGLTYKDADSIRKMMNSLHEGVLSSDEHIKTAHRFIEGCMHHSGLTQAQAEELWERVSSFIGFSFCKSHSASYAQLSFKCSFLKAHYPAQFLAAVISNNHGFYSRDVYLNEARKMGVRILPISINESEIAYYGKHQWIRPGLMHVRSVCRSNLETLITERCRNGRFRNLMDFISRVDMGRKETESLVLVGAFDGFGLTQPELLYTLDGTYNKIRPDRPSLFERDLSLDQRRLHPGLRDYSFAQKCLNELHLLGFMLSGDILDILDLHPAARNTVAASALPRHVGMRVKIFGWPVTQRPHMVERNNEPMLFITLEDRTGSVDVILWPDVYNRFFDTVNESGPFEVWGTVTEDHDTWTLEADTIRSVAWSPAQIDLERASKRLEKSYAHTAAEYAPRTAAA
ncbi:MAG: DNA polymerase III subunit alpha [Chitinispirillaceae bacterium]|jgi:DNA-directed DNA polymerase III PolC